MATSKPWTSPARSLSPASPKSPRTADHRGSPTHRQQALCPFASTRHFEASSIERTKSPCQTGLYLGVIAKVHAARIGCRPPARSATVACAMLAGTTVVRSYASSPPIEAPAWGSPRSGADVMTDDQPFAVVVHEDVTALLEAERLEDEFVAMAAHERRGPMGTLSVYGSMLRRGEAISRGAPGVHPRGQWRWRPLMTGVRPFIRPPLPAPQRPGAPRTRRPSPPPARSRRPPGRRAARRCCGR
jgi:hypothetical protein